MAKFFKVLKSIALVITYRIVFSESLLAVYQSFPDVLAKRRLLRYSHRRRLHKPRERSWEMLDQCLQKFQSISKV